MIEKSGLQRKDIGLAVIGAGRIGSMRARLASAHAGVRFIRIADTNEVAAKALAEKCGASVTSADSLEIISNPAINTVIVASTSTSSRCCRPCNSASMCWSRSRLR